MILFSEEKMSKVQENKRDPAENLGEVPVGANEAILVKQRIGQIGRETTMMSEKT